MFVTKIRDLRFENVRFHIVCAMDSLCMTLSMQYTMYKNDIVSVVHNVFDNPQSFLKWMPKLWKYFNSFPKLNKLSYIFAKVCETTTSTKHALRGIWGLKVPLTMCNWGTLEGLNLGQGHERTVHWPFSPTQLWATSKSIGLKYQRQDGLDVRKDPLCRGCRWRVQWGVNMLCTLEEWGNLVQIFLEPNKSTILGGLPKLDAWIKPCLGESIFLFWNTCWKHVDKPMMRALIRSIFFNKWNYLIRFWRILKACKNPTIRDFTTL